MVFLLIKLYTRKGSILRSEESRYSVLAKHQERRKTWSIYKIRYSRCVVLMFFHVCHSRLKRAPAPKSSSRDPIPKNFTGNFDRLHDQSTPAGLGVVPLLSNVPYLPPLFPVPLPSVQVQSSKVL